MSTTARHHDAIGDLRRRLAGLTAIAGGVIVTGSLAMAVLLLIAADAMLVLPEGIRAATPWALIVSIAVGVMLVVWAVVRLRAVRVARSLESHDASLGTALTNAAQFSAGRYETPLAEHLRNEAVAYGQRLAASQRIWPVAKRGVVTAVGLVAVASVLWAVTGVALPGVLQSVLPRFLDPHGDHPPYSRVRYTVELSDANVLYGGQCEVRVVTAGAPVEQLTLVSRDESGQSKSVMFRRPDRSFFQVLSNLRQPTDLWITDGRGRSKRHRIDIRYTPQITLVEVASEFPAYTGLKPQKRQLKEPELRVPRRTMLRFHVASNRPLNGGVIELTPLMGGQPQRIALSPSESGAQTVEGEFNVAEAMAFALTVTDTDGLSSADAIKGRINISPDQRPRLIVFEPGRHAVATPDTAIPVRLRAEDDYGVDAVLWFRGLNESIERPGHLASQLDAPLTKRNVESAFNLADLGVRPGDRIQYFFEAADNCPDGPNVVTSRMYQLEIISTEQYEMILRSQRAQRQLFAEQIAVSNQLRRLAERARTAQETIEKDPTAAKEQLDALRDAMRDYLKALDKALAQRPLFDIEESFRDHIQEQRDAAEDVAKQIDALAKAGVGGGIPNPEALRSLTKQLEEMAGLMQREVGEPAQQLVAVVRLLATADEFAQLTLQQKELTELTRRMEEYTGELSRLQQMELQEIASAQSRLRDRFRDLIHRMDDRAGELPEGAEFDALRDQVGAFLDKVAEAKIDADLEGAMGKFNVLDGPGGHPLALSAYRKMDALVAKCQAMGGIAGECLNFQPTLKRGIGGSLDQIMAALRNRGMGGDGQSGFGLFGEDVALYGPDIQLDGQQAEGQGPQVATASASTHAAATDATDPALPPPTLDGRVRLQTDERFPLRYRELVGEYFRAVAESQEP